MVMSARYLNFVGLLPKNADGIIIIPKIVNGNGLFVCVCIWMVWGNHFHRQAHTF